MKAYVALGSNMGRRAQNIFRAVGRLSRIKDTTLVGVSNLYETEPVGGPAQRAFLNAVAEVTTTLPPRSLLKALLAIELSFGRIRGKKWGPRIIDLDLLAVDHKVVRKPGLHLPHPRYHERRFVLIPFADVAPRFVHPIYRKTNAFLLRKLTPQGQRVTMRARWTGKRFSPSKTKSKKKSRSSH